MDTLTYKLCFRTFCGFEAGHHGCIQENGSDTKKMPSSMKRKLWTIKHGGTTALLCSSARAVHSYVGFAPRTDVCAQLVALDITSSSCWSIPALAALHILIASEYKASPGLRPWVALLHAFPLPIHGPFHQLRCLTKKKEKKANITDV